MLLLLIALCSRSSIYVQIPRFSTHYNHYKTTLKCTIMFLMDFIKIFIVVQIGLHAVLIPLCTKIQNIFILLISYYCNTNHKTFSSYKTYTQYFKRINYNKTYFPFCPSRMVLTFRDGEYFNLNKLHC